MVPPEGAAVRRRALQRRRAGWQACGQPRNEVTQPTLRPHFPAFVLAPPDMSPGGAAYVPLSAGPPAGVREVVAFNLTRDGLSLFLTRALRLYSCAWHRASASFTTSPACPAPGSVLLSSESKKGVNETQRRSCALAYALWRTALCSRTTDGAIAPVFFLYCVELGLSGATSSLPASSS